MQLLINYGTHSKEVFINVIIQMVRSNKFQMYDYGSAAENRRHYKTPTPPLYDIAAVNVTTSLYWGGKDLLADPM